MTAFACYDVEHLALIGYDVVSNRPKVAAYRAPAPPWPPSPSRAPSTISPCKLSMDPIDLRLLNAAQDGMKTVYGATVRYSAFTDTLEAIKDSDHYKTPLDKVRRGASPLASGSTSAGKAPPPSTSMKTAASPSSPPTRTSAARAPPWR